MFNNVIFDAQEILALSNYFCCPAKIGSCNSRTATPTMSNSGNDTRPIQANKQASFGFAFGAASAFAPFLSPSMVTEPNTSG